MRPRTLLATLLGALVLMLPLFGSTAVANEPKGEGGSGTDTRMYSRSLYLDGNPTKSRDTFCRARLTSPYPISGERVRARFRIECRDRTDLTFTEHVARLKNLEVRGNSADWERRCIPDNATKRTYADVVWWGCGRTLTVEDAYPRKVQDWQASFYVRHAMSGPGADGDPLGGTTSNFVSVISYCRDHAEYCRKNPDKLAMRYWVG